MEVKESCTEQTLKDPQEPAGMACMRRADTEQREAGRLRGTEKDLVRAAAEGARCYIYTPTADKHRSRQQEGQSGQDLPITSRHPPERQEPPYHPTQREEEVEGGEGERTGQTCEARRTQARRRDEHGDRDETKRQLWVVNGVFLCLTRSPSLLLS